MIQKLKNKWKAKKEESYVDFTNLNKSNKYQKYLGLEITARPYKKIAMYSALAVFLISIVTPFTNVFLFPTAFWILRRYG